MRKVKLFTGIWTGFMIVLEITRRILWQSNCSPEIVNIFSVSLRISFVVLVVLIFIHDVIYKGWITPPKITS